MLRCSLDRPHSRKLRREVSFRKVFKSSVVEMDPRPQKIVSTPGAMEMQTLEVRLKNIYKPEAFFKAPDKLSRQLTVMVNESEIDD